MTVLRWPREAVLGLAIAVSAGGGTAGSETAPPASPVVLDPASVSTAQQPLLFDPARLDPLNEALHGTAPFLVAPSPPLARPKPPALSVAQTRPITERVCPVLEAEANEHGLPPVFFARLIWQESSFNPDAVSPKGAQGIAQFMPYTAAERGLADPFDPASALAASARFLRDLRGEFGNLGLAAAAYNAGPQRVRNWLAGNAVLPLETQNYVVAITGHAAEDWTAKAPTLPALAGVEAKAFQTECLKLAATISSRPRVATAGAPQVRRQPWGVQVAGGFSQAKAMASYAGVRQRLKGVLGGREPMVLREKLLSRGTRPLFAVRFGADDRASAEALCGKLRAAGGACMVVKN